MIISMTAFFYLFPPLNENRDDIKQLSVQLNTTPFYNIQKFNIKQVQNICTLIFVISIMHIDLSKQNAENIHWNFTMYIQ